MKSALDQAADNYYHDPLRYLIEAEVLQKALEVFDNAIENAIECRNRVGGEPWHSFKKISILQLAYDREIEKTEECKNALRLAMGLEALEGLEK